jgi:transposase
MKTYFGVDYHKKFSHGIIMDEKGIILKQGRFNNNKQSIEKFLGDFMGNGCCSVLEATRNWTVAHDILEKLTEDVTLAHPLKVRAIAEAKIKTDKIDSTTLAHLLRCDLVPSAHVSSPKARITKNLLRHRMFLVRLQTMVKNRIHVLLDRHPPLRPQKPANRYFSQVGIAELKKIRLPKYDQYILHSEISLLEHLKAQIKETNRWLAGVGKKDKRVKRLLTIPGIGRTIALLLVSEIDDIERFRSDRKLHAYAGLVPSTHSSAGRTFHGRLIKTGNKYIRWAMIEAVWPAIRSDIGLYNYFQKFYCRKGANRARVCTARRLLTIIYKVLKEKREYRHVA